jgi:4-amino-4-deoxy-L-arabinose transferase-like glycosyltransferase
MRLLGPEDGKIAVVALQVLALALTIVFTYLLGKALMGPWTGLIAAGWLAVLPGPARWAVYALDTAVLGAMIVTGILLLLLRCIDRPSIRRTMALGMGIGTGGLTLAPTVMLGPVAAIALLVESIRRRSSRPLIMIFVAGLIAVVVIAPWTIRNAQTFGAFIPIQTGLGNFANFTNTYVAETFMSELEVETLNSPPPWKSTGPLDAVQKLHEEYDNSTKLIHRSLESIAADPPPGWEYMSEPERDRVHLAQFRNFVTEHPMVFIQIMMSKALMLFILLPAEFEMSIMWPVEVTMYLVAYVGLVFTLRKRAVYVLPLTILLVTFPLLITAPLFYRYRLPVEPLFAILAAGTIVICLQSWICHQSRSHEHVELKS